MAEVGLSSLSIAAKRFRKKGGKDDEGGYRQVALLGIAARIKMGRKGEKSLSKDKNQSSASQDAQDEDSNKTPEPYNCSGFFQPDFTELCHRQDMTYIPQIVPRPRPPAPSPSQAAEGKPEKGKDKNKQLSAPEPDPEPLLDEDGEPVEPPPKTYTMKDKFEYFKPSIQVEMDNPDKLDTVTEVYIRGWKVDDCMMEIFKQCWPAMERLHTINLWQVGLTGETVAILASFIPLCMNLKNLILDGNSIQEGEENWHLLVDDDSSVQLLSLQHCSVSDEAAVGIGKALGTAKRFNTKLMSLNLAGNRITDVGAEHLAGGLRMNRSLLSLSLANNHIGDKGVKKIAEALSRFPLTHEEVVERRRLISEKGSPERNKSPPPSRRAESKDRPGSVRSSSHTDKDKSKRDKPSAKKNKDPKAKEEDKKGGTRKEKDDKGSSKKDPRGARDHRPASIAADAGKSVGKTKDKKVKKPTPQEQEQPDVPEVINPLMEVADYMSELKTLMVAGNRVLLNLNLSRNQITEDGVEELIKAAQYQKTLLMDNKINGTGLMRICLHKNKVSADSDELKKLNDMMAAKHPFYKPPATPDGEAV
ncbi:leucine-rich repeat-containing protein 71-like isoform X4 [Haliotis rufescens]|uniref:leucine-rich repeat-containing protein 71-like isoform X4 n=1 Tax=Haliotis rufescens TaxID=6454 RepID=UPI00201F3DC4|nr:leucine-rich repeat-containing protein 71-like isoform X4 [Haliotis rufescens]